MVRPLRESNPRPFPYQGNALPTMLRGLTYKEKRTGSQYKKKTRKKERKMQGVGFEPTPPKRTVP